MKISNNVSIIAVIAAVAIIGIAAYAFLSNGFTTPGNSVRVQVVQDLSCMKCPPTTPVVNSLKDNGVPVEPWHEYDYNSTEGRELIKKYNLTRAPVIVISENLINYMPEAVNISKVGDSYVVYPINPPYRDFAQDKVVGLVDIFFITDQTCSQCYNYTIHADELTQAFKVVFGSALYFDVNFPAGDEFVSRYNITAVPTYILTADAKYYPRLLQVWPSVGTIESNGYFVFRNVSQIGQTYKNLTSGQIINPLNQSA